VLAILARFLRRRRAQPALEDRESASDEALMVAYAAGDAEAFEILYDRHEGPVFRFIRRSVGSDERAEELAQDVFVRVIRSAEGYKASAKFTTWLYTIARNACIDEARRRRRRPEFSLDAPVGDDAGATFLDRLVDPNARGGGAELAKQAFLEHLEQGLCALPDEQREVFLLRHFEGMRFVEIAGILGISDNTVKSRMRYAMQTLRGYLAAFEGTSLDGDNDDEVGERS
jgi:RNA polymerase sigma-70 factor, ECF subfamily